MHCHACGPDQYWYYYRRLLDCSDVYRKYDAVELQRNCYGLDFEKITEAELRRAVGELVSAMYEMMGMPKQPLQGKKNVEDLSS